MLQPGGIPTTLLPQKKHDEKKKEEKTEIEHPEDWHLMSLKKHQIMRRKQLSQHEVLELLQFFDTEKFRGLEKNTGKDAFRAFFNSELGNLGSFKVDMASVQGTGEIIMEKIEQILVEYNVSLLEKQKDIPVRLGDELLSYEEVNVFTLALFYKFAVHLATKYLKFVHPNSPGPAVHAHAPATAANVNAAETGTVSDMLDDVNKFIRTTFGSFHFHKEEDKTERTEVINKIIK